VQLTVTVPVHLGAIPPDAVQVELYADGEGAEPPLVVRMEAVDIVHAAPRTAIYGATVTTSRPAAHFTPRVVPYHPEAQLPMELPLIAWQR
jgi:starch phosphorylase